MSIEYLFEVSARFSVGNSRRRFSGSITPVGIDDDGRERLVFIQGDVPVEPFPLWSQSDDALVSVAVLLRELHEASKVFDASAMPWNTDLADPAGGRIVCHNDVCLENVVFRDGVAVGLLDFDFAAPGRPIYDLAQFARMCVPLEDDDNAARRGWQSADRIRRLRLVADAYGLDVSGRTQLISIVDESMARAGAFVKRHVDAGDPNFIKMWNDMGGIERFDRQRRWWASHDEEVFSAMK